MFRRITVLTGLMSIIGLVLMQSPASAGHGEISLPIVTFVQASEGDLVQLASSPVDPELVGTTCAWEFHAINQESIHPGNDLILSTGGVDTVVPGVEDAPNQVLDVVGSFQLGETVTVSLRMGPDQMFSARLSVEVVCADEVAPATVTTTPAPTTSVAPVPTTAAPVVDTEVAGNVVTAEPAADAAPALAITGPSSFTGPLVWYSVFLLLGGIGFLRLRTLTRD
jgi:hypothetical protein